MERIKKGDQIIVLTGRDRGKRGSVLRRIDKDHILVEGINRVKKHQRPNPMKNQPGGIIDKEMPIHVSNISLLNPQTQRQIVSASSYSMTAARFACSSPTAKRSTPKLHHGAEGVY